MRSAIPGLPSTPHAEAVLLIETPRLTTQRTFGQAGPGAIARSERRILDHPAHTGHGLREAERPRPFKLALHDVGLAAPQEVQLEQRHMVLGGGADR
jgi:hypothetical protein